MLSALHTYFEYNFTINSKNISERSAKTVLLSTNLAFYSKA